MAIITGALAGYPDRSENHTDLDRQILREQQQSDNNLNPFTGYYRYKLIDKRSGKFYRVILVPKITRFNSLSGRFIDEYQYVPYPYKSFSIRKVYWLFKTLWRNRLDIFLKIIGSTISKELWHVLRGVIILLIAYTIWAIFQDEILAFWRK